MPTDIRMSWWILNRLFFIHIWLLWRMPFTGKGRSWRVLHTTKTLSKTKNNSFLMLNLFFYSLAFLLTWKHQKLHAGWDHVSDLNLNVTIWVNSFAGSHAGSGLNFPEVQRSNLRKQNTPKTLDINLGCNSSTINGATRWKKLAISLYLRQD